MYKYNIKKIFSAITEKVVNGLLTHWKWKAFINTKGEKKRKKERKGEKSNQTI